MYMKYRISIIIGIADMMWNIEYSKQVVDRPLRLALMKDI